MKRIGLSIASLLVSSGVVLASPNPCPANLPDSVLKRTASCNINPTDVEVIKGPEKGDSGNALYEDVYLFCGGKLTSNIFPDVAVKAVCWSIDKTTATVWYEVLDIPKTPLPPSVKK